MRLAACLVLLVAGCFNPPSSGTLGHDGGGTFGDGGSHFHGGGLPSGAPQYGLQLFTPLPSAFIDAHVGYFLYSPTNTFRFVFKGTANGKTTASHFYGSLWTVASFTSVTPGCGGACPLDPGDFVSDPVNVAGGQRVDWDASNAGDVVDGFDFVVAGTPLFVDAWIDGKHVASEFWFPATATGGQPGNPTSIPFELSGS